MKKRLIIAGFILIIVSLLFAGCTPDIPEEPEPVDECPEFMFEFTPNPDAKYEIARDDIFTSTMGDFKSTEISFFGIMLGNSYARVIEKVGVPDVMYMPEDESFKNMEYRKKIGICGMESGITYHLENDIVTRITVKPNFKKYMHGNTSIGIDKEIVYTVVDIPDYQDFLDVYRIFHYVEKGMDIYFRNRYINRISFTFPAEFKGIEYVTIETIAKEGIPVNVVKPVLKE